MPRIISGAARGRRLAVPAHGTRPTSDRVREALFNRLATLLDLDGARVLDLYAGSGAVGLEALSRGAAAVTLVESDRAAVATLRANVTAVGLPGADVQLRTAIAFLRAPTGGPFDVVFADPPYALDDDELAGALNLLQPVTVLNAGAVVVVERPARAAQPRWPVVIQQTQQRRYGDAALWYGLAP